mgnify:CR=1
GSGRRLQPEISNGIPVFPETFGQAHIDIVPLISVDDLARGGTTQSVPDDTHHIRHGESVPGKCLTVWLNHQLRFTGNLLHGHIPCSLNCSDRRFNLLR